jgi:hypothetical protein
LFFLNLIYSSFLFSLSKSRKILLSHLLKPKIQFLLRVFSKELKILHTIKSFFTHKILSCLLSISNLSVSKKTKEFFILRELKYFNHTLTQTIQLLILDKNLFLILSMKLIFLFIFQKSSILLTILIKFCFPFLAKCNFLLKSSNIKAQILSHCFIADNHIK